jgi:hypothetical protein
VDKIEEAFERTGTDKLWRHGYHRHYEDWLRPHKNKAGLDLLEIGTKDGKSLVSWMLYFDDVRHVDAMRYGEGGMWDCEKAKHDVRVDCDKINIFEGDQSKKADIGKMTAARPEGWDIIVDDGSHVPSHNILSFKLLWNSIKPGGIYVVEDIETSWMEGKCYGYEIHGGLYKPAPANAVTFFKDLVDVVNRKHFLEPSYTLIPGDEDIAEIVFGDGLLMIRKAADPIVHRKWPHDLALGMWKTDDKNNRVFDDQSAVHEYKRMMHRMHSWLDILELVEPNNLEHESTVRLDDIRTRDMVGLKQENADLKQRVKHLETKQILLMILAGAIICARIMIK